MKFEAKPQQAFLIFSMLFGATPEQREPTRTDAGKILGDTKLRDELIREHLIREEERRSESNRKATHLILDDGAWDWATKNLGSTVSATKGAAPLLQSVLARLGAFLETHDHALSEFVAAGQKTAEEPTAAPTSTPKSAAARKARAARKSTSPKPAAARKPKAAAKPKARTKTTATKPVATASKPVTAKTPIAPSAGGQRLEERIRAACLQLTNGSTKQRVRLKDLRQALDEDRTEVDRVLQAMQREGLLVLYKIDNPAELTHEDERAALYIANNPRHLVYLEG